MLFFHEKSFEWFKRQPKILKACHTLPCITGVIKITQEQAEIYK